MGGGSEGLGPTRRLGRKLLLLCLFALYADSASAVLRLRKWGSNPSVGLFSSQAPPGVASVGLTPTATLSNYYRQTSANEQANVHSGADFSFAGTQGGEEAEEAASFADARVNAYSRLRPYNGDINFNNNEKWGSGKGLFSRARRWETASAAEDGLKADDFRSPSALQVAAQLQGQIADEQGESSTDKEAEKESGAEDKEADDSSNKSDEEGGDEDRSSSSGTETSNADKPSESKSSAQETEEAPEASSQTAAAAPQGEAAKGQQEKEKEGGEEEAEEEEEKPAKAEESSKAEEASEDKTSAAEQQQTTETAAAAGGPGKSAESAGEEAAEGSTEASKKEAGGEEEASESEKEKPKEEAEKEEGEEEEEAKGGKPAEEEETERTEKEEKPATETQQAKAEAAKEEKEEAPSTEKEEAEAPSEAEEKPEAQPKEEAEEAETTETAAAPAGEAAPAPAPAPAEQPAAKPEAAAAPEAAARPPEAATAVEAPPAPGGRAGETAEAEEAGKEKEAPPKAAAPAEAAPAPAAAAPTAAPAAAAGAAAALPPEESSPEGIEGWGSSARRKEYLEKPVEGKCYSEIAKEILSEEDALIKKASENVHFQEAEQGFCDEVFRRIDGPFSLMELSALLRAADVANSTHRNFRYCRATPNSSPPRVNDGDSILHAAIAARKPHVVEVLLQYGAFPELPALPHKEGQQALMKAPLHALNPADMANGTPLHAAALVQAPDSVEAMDLLLHYGAKTDSRDTWGRTPLMVAAFHPTAHSHEFIKKLILAKADVKATDKAGLSALHYAAAADNWGVVGILLDHGAEAAGVDTRGNTPLHYAASFNSYAATMRLLEKAELAIKNINQKNARGKAPIHLAAAPAAFPAVPSPIVPALSLEALLMHHANPMARDNEGNTPLHLAAKGGYVEIARRLVAMTGAPADEKNAAGLTALDVVEKAGKGPGLEEMAEFLRVYSQKRSCIEPPLVRHSTRIFSDTMLGPYMRVGDTVTYTCNPGFTMLGHATVTCHEREGKMEFVPSAPLCIRSTDQQAAAAAAASPFLSASLSLIVGLLLTAAVLAPL